jgi:hypothetical protein
MGTYSEKVVRLKLFYFKIAFLVGGCRFLLLSYPNLPNLTGAFKSYKNDFFIYPYQTRI